MKRNLLLLSGIAVLSLSANAQELKEDYMLPTSPSMAT